MTELTLFCLPYAGGSAARIYGAWRSALPGYIQVVPVEPPGRGTRIGEPLLLGVDAMTHDALGTVLPRLDGPYALFGHSLGALVAFELARRLEHAHGRPAVHLFVSGHGAPQLPRTPDLDYRLPNDQFRDRLRELAGTPEEVLAHEELLDVVIPVIRADFEAADTYVYRPAPRLTCPITVYGGTGDPEAPVATLEPWRVHTTGPCTVRVLAGNHFFLEHERDALLAAVCDDLNESRFVRAS